MPLARNHVFTLVLLLIGVRATAGNAGLPHGRPSEVDMDAGQLSEIDGVVMSGLSERKLPGCVVCIGRRGKIVYLKAFGSRQLLPTETPMTTDTLFDLASLTKPVATATCIMCLVESGQLALTDRVTAWMPDFEVNGKGMITIYDLLTHQSGLLPDNPLADYEQGPDEAMRRICQLGLRAPTGSQFIYSDVNFILLGAIVERITGQTLHEYSQAKLFRRLNMKETGFIPSEDLKARAAPTEQRDGKWLQGDVHDPRAWRLGGIAGHAGLFSTAEDLAIYSQTMIEQGSFQGIRVLSAEHVEAMTRNYSVPAVTVDIQAAKSAKVSLRGLGWDKQSGFSTNRGSGMSTASFGHGGFTGTAIWIDPEAELFVIFLSNRLHPDGKGLVNPMAGRIGTIAVEAILK